MTTELEKVPTEVLMRAIFTSMERRATQLSAKGKSKK